MVLITIFFRCSKFLTPLSPLVKQGFSMLEEDKGRKEWDASVVFTETMEKGSALMAKGQARPLNEDRT